MRTTTQCPGCQAPVSVGEPACWSCGGGLARPAATVPTHPPQPRRPVAPGPYSRTCPACRETIALYHRSCPACGQTSAPSTMALTPPAGWTEAVLPDGAVHLERSPGGRMQKVGLTLLVAGITLIHRLVYYTDFSTARGALPPDAALVERIAGFVIAAFLCLLVAGALAWVWTGRETWFIRTGLLEIRNECLGRKWSRSVAAQELTLETDDSLWSSRRRARWKLVAGGAGPKQVLVDGGLLHIEQLIALGAYLAARTGWRWHPPQDIPLLSSLFGTGCR